MDAVTMTSTMTSSFVNEVKGRMHLVIMLSVFSVCGVLGNAVVLFVFGKRSDGLVSTFFILLLAAIDFTTSLFVMPATAYLEYVDMKIGDHDILCKLYQFSLTSVIPLSALIMTAIAVDRYLCICHPHVKLLTVPRAKVISAVLVTLAFGLGITTSLIFGVYKPAVADATTPLVTMTTDSSFQQLPTHSRTYVDVTTGKYTRLVGNDALVKEATNSNVSAPVVTFTGLCIPNFMLISADAAYAYQKAYYSIYLVCLITVVVLYVLIYRSVAARHRSKRSRSALSALRPPSAARALLLSDRRTTKTDIDPLQATPMGGVETVLLLPLKRRRSLCDETEVKDGCRRGSIVMDAITAERRCESESEGRAQEQQHQQQPSTPPYQQGQGQDQYLLLLPTAQADLQPGTGHGGRSASVVTTLIRHTIGRRQLSARGSVGGDFLPNIRLAAMLSVVAAVFIIAFFPAFLMSMEVVQHTSVVFYLYFAYNIANPLIYSFMNKTFRDELAYRLLRRQRKRAASRLLSVK